MSTNAARARANDEQLLASDPAVSAFVGASAGSGKTKLLTDRLLRLMLAGAEPGRIQCLTFTKAAAAEMALRLQRRLGEWVTLDDAALDAALGALAVVPTPAVRARARALFAEVLDLPGGMRIGTIHAFCQSLLRRFPLEALISPHFQLIEDRDAEEAMRESREAVLALARGTEAEAALEVLAGVASAKKFGDLTASLRDGRDRLRAALALGPAALAETQRRVLGATAADAASVRQAAVTWPESQALRAAALRVAERGSPACQAKARRILAWLEAEPERQSARWGEWADEFLNGDGEARGDGAFVNPKLAGSCDDLIPTFLAEAERIIAVDDACRALKMAEISAALVALGAPVVEGYTGRKEATGHLDYADLIGRTSGLLVDPGAAWVLYKLDGGLDHLLLDEVQDTAPAQWKIAHALTAEFFAGEGARDGSRTVFAVGDRKQSIFSFQGADIDTFDDARAELGIRVRAAKGQWRDATLDVSFRSTVPVLQLVDAVFSDPRAAAGVVEPGQTLSHFADRAGHAGQVELWPLAPRPRPAEPAAWEVPEENQNRASAPQTLAERLADWVRDQTDGSVMLESRGRKLAPSDIMVLVRRRNGFARQLVRALKVRGVPVAGLDRLVLTEQPAVQDLLALCDVLLLPQDDLALACVLTSPLGGLSDDSLMRLAVERPASLWETLRTRAGEQPDWSAAWDFLSGLLSRVDYGTPHTLLTEALGPLGGRARLYGRLGPEAAEPIDEVLNAALAYTRTHPPSLQGFLHWLRQSGAEVTRQPEAAGNTVRIMTVHGAKGLQAPVVVLPDTTALPKDDDGLLWATDPATGVEVPLWSPRKDLRCRAAERIREREASRRTEEYNRLLYVALTRAEDRLVVCGWEPHHTPPDACWYTLVARGFGRIGATDEPFGEWGTRLVHKSPQLVPVSGQPETGPAAAVQLPAWAGQSPDWRPAPPPGEPARPEPLAPSRPEGAGLGTVPNAASPLALREPPGQRFKRGQIIHALLQHLPALPADGRAGAARVWLERPGQGLDAADRETIVRDTFAILEHPALATLFGPGSRAEVPLTGFVGGMVVGGLVDRLAILPDAVLIADYKTSRKPPPGEAAVPTLYLRQMAAYRAVLREIFPERPVHCALIWTQGAQVTFLSDGLLDNHAQGTVATPLARAAIA